MTPTLERPTWHSFFFGLAFAYARRSRDPRTRHGCVIVDPRNNHFVAAGYNSFLAGLPDEDLPTEAPEKYAHVDHSEVNAADTIRFDPFSVPGGLAAYITGWPCYPCARALVRHNVLTWHVADRDGHTDPTRDRRDDTMRVVRHRGIRVEVHQADVSWLADPDWHAELRSAGMMGQGVGTSRDTEEGHRGETNAWFSDMLDEHFAGIVIDISIPRSGRRLVTTAEGNFEVDLASRTAQTLPTPCLTHFDLRDEQERVTLRSCLFPETTPRTKPS